jgi:flagellar hook-length control protein FliK
MLESNIQSLVNSLEENGVSVGGFSVALQNNGNNSGYAEANNKGYFSNDPAERENDTVPVKADKARGLVNIFA